MLQTIPLTYRCQQTVQFLEQVQKQGLWLVLGEPEEPWPYPQQPPVPDPRWASVPVPLAYKQVDYVSAVFPDAVGSLFTTQGNYRPVQVATVENLLAAKAFNIFISVDLDFTDLSIANPFEYSILALSLGVKRTSEEVFQRALRPQDVFHPGNLVWAATQKPARLSPVEGLALRHVIHF